MDEMEDMAGSAELDSNTESVDVPGETTPSEAPEARRRLVARVIQDIKGDKAHHKKAFDRMRRDMQVAMWGAEETWGEDKYRANIVGRHIRAKVAALYAKNPRVVAKRPEQLDFAVWDEDPASLQLAMQTVMAAQQAMQMPTLEQDPVTGEVVPVEPQLPPGFEQAQAIVADFQQGMARRQMMTRIGKTLEVLFAKAMREQKPLDFKMAMKQLVRRALTTGVGYVEIGFQREMGPRPEMQERLADFRARLDHLRALAEKAASGEIEPVDAEIAELEASINSLMNEPEIVLREGLIFDFPPSTKVIPDRLCKQLVGFVGARRVTIEYDYTVDQVREVFGVDLGKHYVPYRTDGECASERYEEDVQQGDLFDGYLRPQRRGDDIVRVWKQYDKESGLVYVVADGYPDFLREPAAPDVFVEDFWPVYALTFNAVESETELFPPSDVSLLLDQQREYNRSRQGKREHREAARPRWAYARGALSERDETALTTVRPFQAVPLDFDTTAKIGDILQPIPVPGVDPNLYDTGEIFTDMQLTVGAQEAQLGGVSKATATEAAIAEGAATAADGASIDDLDAFLTMVARASGQVLLREMSPEIVTQKVGPGAVWPEATLAEIADEIYLEIEAGSTGKPNQAVEINNFQQLAPILMQIPGISPMWLAKEALRRLDDRLDLTEAVAAGIPSIVAQNQLAGQSANPAVTPAENPNDEPAAQGREGASNAPKPEEQPGSDPAFGSNQV